MYNGIGLVTPRGSGTNGYVTRNLSHLRPRDGPADRKDFDFAPPKHREPDQGILDHERRRKVEVRCMELQVELEEKDFPEEEIEKEVEALRTRLLQNLDSIGPTPAKALKLSDTHGLAAAKKEELSKMARAFGTSSNYTEGDAFNREKQDQLRVQRAVDREESDRHREETRLQRIEDQKKYEAEKKEKDRLRRREEDRLRKEAAARERLPPAGLPAGVPSRPDAPSYSRRRDPSPPTLRGRSQSRSPPPRRRSPSRDYHRRRSPSPRRIPSRRSPSHSPPPRSRYSRSPGMDDSPPRRNRVRSSRSRSPPPRRRSPSPEARRAGRDRSPLRRSRSRSLSGSSMSVSGSEKSRSKVR